MEKKSPAKFEINAHSSSMGKLIENGQASGFTCKILVTTVNSLVRKSAVPNVDFANIDTERHELGEFRGTRSVIDRFAPTILIIFHLVELLRDGDAFVSDRN